MSVDARTLTLAEDVLKPGTRSAELAFRRADDAFLIQSIAWSFPLPELTLAVDPEQPAAHPKDTVTQTATVTNVGGAPATGVEVCGQNIGTIAPKARPARAPLRRPTTITRPPSPRAAAASRVTRWRRIRP